MLNAIIISAIILAIALGYTTKINTGFFGIAFAYLIGVWGLDMKPGQIISTWPISIFFVIFGISLFYNFAISNGTLEKLSQHMLYRTRKFPRLLPIAIFFAATVIAALGAGFFAVMAFFTPITLIICRKTGLNSLLGALAVNYGALCGNNFMLSPGGVVFIGLMKQAGFEEQAYVYDFYIFLASFFIPVVVLAVMIAFNKPLNLQTIDEVSLPKPFDEMQRKTLMLIIGMVISVLVFPVLHMIFPENAFITSVDKSIDVGLISIIFVVIGLLLNIGAEKDIIKNIPWGTLIMICGVGMLISIAIKAGTVNLIASWVSTTIPAPIVPVAMAVIGGFMSFFSSVMGVVAPALFPLIATLSLESGISAPILFSSLVIGAQATAISPFSSGGSLILSSVKETEREKMFTQLMFKGAPLCLGVAMLYALIINMLN